MIEGHALPTLGGVARVAFIAERALVLIVFFVTGNTARRCALERRADMAAFARHYAVQPGQRKLCLGVIEYDFVFPAILVVAVVTALALLAFVYIVETVTTETGARQFIVHIAAVA